MMKLTVLCFFLGVIQIMATESYSQEARLSLSQNNQRLKDVLKTIEDKSKYFFFYNRDMIDVEQKVNIDATNQTITVIMDELLRGKNIRYEIIDRQIILSNLKNTQGLTQQQTSVSGKVTDSSGTSLPGVNVVIKGTSIGTVTIIDGTYILNNIPRDATLVFSFLGMKTQEVVVAGRTQTIINVSMEEYISDIEEVVAIGYGTVKKGNLTTAVTTLNSDLLQNRPAQSISDVLQGTVSGLRVTSNGGKPGSSASMQLRGATSLNDGGTPLILVDGVPGEFNFLNIDDIENITVLKDAASAAIYGSRSAHGVILVTTKRGKTNKPTFRYNGYAGINTPTDMPKNISSSHYAQIRNEAAENMERTGPYSAEDIKGYASGTDPDRYPNTDWIKLLMQNSFTTRHSLAATGGSENVRYYLGAGFDHQTGVIDQVSQDVFNVRSNVDVDITKKLNLSFDMRYVLRQKDEVLDLSGIIIDMYKVNPTMGAYYSDGSYYYNSSFIINPIGYLYQTGHEDYSVHDGSGIFKIEYEILDGLKLSGIGNANYVFYDVKQMGKMLYFKNPYTGEEITKSQNTLFQKRENKIYYNLQALVNYKKTLGLHSIDILAGYQQENEKKSWIEATREGYLTDIVYELDAGPKDNWSNGGNGNHWAISSFLGRINYDYDGKYLLTFNMRSDGSSRFSKGHRWSTFPSIAAAWRLSGEKFMEATTYILNDLKIRASWGKTGASSGVGLYPSYTTISMSGVVLGNTYRQTAYLGTLGNTELGWEKTTMFDIGLDALLLNNRLSFIFDYYKKNTNEILLELPVPLEYGFSKPKVNIGEVENRGWEVDLKWMDHIGNVKYQIQANLSNNKNKVLDIGGTAPWIDGSTYTVVGKPMKSIYGYESLGIFQSQEEIDNAPFQNILDRQGDIQYKNQNDDNKIDGNDRVILGDTNPHYLYGIRLAAEYKGFDISMFFQGIGKKDYIMSGPGIQPLTDNGGGPVFKHQLDYWTPENRDAKYPRILNSGDASRNYQTSDYWKINAGYFRMKNLQVGYNFSNSLLQNAGLSNMRVFFTATNLFTIDDFIPGYDPETTNAYTYPLAKTYSLGINFQF